MTVPAPAVEFLQVRNWKRFQHYRDRSPVWIKLYCSMLDDYDFAALPDIAKAHLVSIWLLASRNKNRIPNDPVWIKQRIGALESIDLQLFVTRGWLEPYSDASNSLADPEHPASTEKRRGEGEKRREEKKGVDKSTKAKQHSHGDRSLVLPLMQVEDGGDSERGPGFAAAMKMKELLKSGTPEEIAAAMLELDATLPPLEDTA